MTLPLRPFLKWAGGKRWLFTDRRFVLPQFGGRYIEPFLGGGAVFFHAQPSRAILGDSNGRLIELYKAIRDDVESFEIHLKKHARRHSRDYYYEVRKKHLRLPTTRAAQFLYLNRTCWNGLYRENLRGEFNVPIGTKETVVFESDDFQAWSDALSTATLLCRDFESVIDDAGAGDFVFVDPPYTVKHNVNGFVKYNQKMFAWDDQVRLREALSRAVTRGVSFMMTNADHESIRGLYAGLGEQRRLFRHSVIAPRPSDRLVSTELLVTNLGIGSDSWPAN
ncbi:MAG: Dam family site-specific DNA-(adenine-N6)-methyltransferase [Gammaproteobacteria bacterium]|nr:Dam family site-specific DNA-(adenine-N6)-methyltransferase [Gammaproteobacteria bacterium]